MPLFKLYGREEIKQYYNSAVQFGLQASRTAQEILAYLSRAKRDYDVVLLEPDQTFGQMAIAGEQNPEVAVARRVYEDLSGKSEFERPTVFWSPTYVFQYYSDVVGLKPDGSFHTPKTIKTTVSITPVYVVNSVVKSGGAEMPQSNVVIRATLSKFSPWVTLFHELGHVKQLYEGGGVAEWAQRIGQPAGVDAIEADNLARHENPICVECNIPVRQYYKFFPAHLKEKFDKRKPELMKVATNPAHRAEIEKELNESAKYVKL